MIKADLVNDSTLLKTIQYDAHTELWLRYACLSDNIRSGLETGSTRARALYGQHDRAAALSFAALIVTLAVLVPAFLARNIFLLAAALTLLTVFTVIEFRKKNILLELARELLGSLFTGENTPKGTLYQFGEEMSRRYRVTSFVDFTCRIDTLLRRCFLALYAAAGFIYLSTDWKAWACLLAATAAWPLFLRPVRILRLFLQLA